MECYLLGDGKNAIKTVGLAGNQLKARKIVRYDPCHQEPLLQLLINYKLSHQGQDDGI